MKILEGVETREAKSAWTPDGEAGWTVGKIVKRITVYNEAGWGGYVPYLRVELHDGHVIHALAAHYEVIFSPEIEEEESE